MATFGLVHGAWHGAWCWDLLIPELERRGHSAVAMDLPCEDPKASFSDYRKFYHEAWIDVRNKVCPAMYVDVLEDRFRRLVF